MLPQDSAASWDFAHGDGDPTPDKYTGDEPDSHGTSCAGEVGMAKDNSHCGVGVAYNARIGGELYVDTILQHEMVAMALMVGRFHLPLYVPPSIHHDEQ